MLELFKKFNPISISEITTVPWFSRYIINDIDKILSYFPETHWTDINIERWRYNYEPLEAYYPDQKLFQEWKEEIYDYTDEEVEKVKKQPIWLFVITATKRAD